MDVVKSRVKVGDRVKCINATGLMTLEQGKVYQVMSLETESYGLGYKIKYEELEELGGYDDTKYWADPEEGIGTFNAERFKLDVGYLRRKKLNKLYKCNYKNDYIDEKGM